MLKAILQSIREETIVPRLDAPDNLRRAMKNADATQQGSRIRHLPAEALKNACINANNRVVSASIALDRAKADVERCHKELVLAEGARLRAQHAFLRDSIEAGAFEGVRDFNELIKATLTDEPDLHIEL